MKDDKQTRPPKRVKVDDKIKTEPKEDIINDKVKKPWMNEDIVCTSG